MDDSPLVLKQRSRNLTEGKSRAPNRSIYYALGYTAENFKKPMIGVANGHSTITPCNSGLQKLADSAIVAAMAPSGFPPARRTESLTSPINPLQLARILPFHRLPLGVA